MSAKSTRIEETWPPLPIAEWEDTRATLHLWTQIVGKVRMTQSAWMNHSWHVTLYVTARGLTTSPMPHGSKTFQIDFDFIDHRLTIEASDGATGGFALGSRSVAWFYEQLMSELDRLGLPVLINHPSPNEIPDPITPFPDDDQHATYDAEYAHRFWRVLVQADRVFKRFRSRFLGKCSPVHFFWGGPDLAVTRFSGKPAPPHPGGIPHLPLAVAQEAYSHEVSSCGFWPGNASFGVDSVFYAYAYPEPDGFASVPVRPEGAFYSKELREFLLPYEVLRGASDPDAALLAFLQSTYEAATISGRWNREFLERSREPRAPSQSRSTERMT